MKLVQYNDFLVSTVGADGLDLLKCVSEGIIDIVNS